MKRGATLVLVLAGLLVASSAVAQETVLRTDGELQSGDERLEGIPVDWYTISVSEAGRLLAHVVSVDFEPRLLIRSGEEAEATSSGNRGSATLSTFVPERREVEVGVTAVGDDGETEAPQGVYSVRVTRQDAPDALSIGETRRGVIEAGDEQLADQRYVDWYPLQLDSQARVFISVSSSDFDTYLVLQRPDGSTIENDDYNDSNAGVTYTTDGPVVLQVGVTSYSAGETGQYDVSVAELALPRKIEIGQTIIGRLDAEDAPLGNTDAYSLSGSPGDLAVLRLSSADFDTVLELRTADGTVRENDDAPSDTTDSQLFHAFEDTRPVEIVVRSFHGDGDGKYELSILNFVSEEQIESVSDGQVIENGERISAILDQDSPVREGRPFHRYTFEAEEERRVRATAESQFFDTFLTVVSPSGVRFEDDDGAGGTDSLVDMQAPESGVYELFVTTFSPSGIGPYTVQLQEGERVSVIERFEAELSSATADRDDQGRLVAEHRFAGRSGREVTIEARSDEFDTRIALEDPSGTIVAENDDYGSGTDSRIIRTLDEEGTYTVYVSGYWEDSEGLYTLVISE
ncbi:MAG: hypothetical protein ACOCYC_00555 [bacterium]